MKKYELLIFDWDGTLADSAAQIVEAMQGAIAALRLPERTDDEIRQLIGLGLTDVLERLYPEIETPMLLGLLGEYRRQYLHEAYREAPLFAGSLAAMQRLAEQGYRIAIATGKSRAGLNRALKHHVELDRLLCSSRTADETASKPDPLMLKELLFEQDLPPDRALMIGDTEYDAQMARAAGMHALGVSCGVHDAERLFASGVRTVLDGVGALPGWLES